MGTRLKPGKFDCIHKAEDDEPVFVLLGRDPQAPDLIRKWARWRNLPQKSERDKAKAREAFECADAMDFWRKVKRNSKRKLV